MTRKRRASLTTAQLNFTFNAPLSPSQPGDLSDLQKLMSSSIARMLNEDGRDRQTIAEAMSLLLSERVTKLVLEGYASEARREHNMSGHRWMALVAVTGRFDVLDAVLTRIGARALEGDEMATAQLGHLHAQRAELDEQIREVKARAKPFNRQRA